MIDTPAILKTIKALPAWSSSAVLRSRGRRTLLLVLSVAQPSSVARGTRTSPPHPPPPQPPPPHDVAYVEASIIAAHPGMPEQRNARPGTSPARIATNQDTSLIVVKARKLLPSQSAEMQQWRKRMVLSKPLLSAALWRRTQQPQH